jgi:hypothetical protein
MPFAVPVRLPERQILCNIVVEAQNFYICQLSFETLDWAHFLISSIFKM